MALSLVLFEGTPSRDAGHSIEGFLAEDLARRDKPTWKGRRSEGAEQRDGVAIPAVRQRFRRCERHRAGAWGLRGHFEPSGASGGRGLALTRPFVPGQNELVAFNAGKMTVEPAANGKFLISPDLKKGKICLTRGDDQLLHFQWIDRTTGASPEVRYSTRASTAAGRSTTRANAAVYGDRISSSSPTTRRSARSTRAARATACSSCSTRTRPGGSSSGCRYQLSRAWIPDLMLGNSLAYAHAEQGQFA